MEEIEKTEDYWKKKYELLEQAIGWLPDAFKKEIRLRAAGYAGGKAHPKLKPKLDLSICGEEELLEEIKRREFKKGQPDMSDVHVPSLKWQEKAATDFIIIPDYISIVGSSVHNPETAEDLDILIRDNYKNESLQVAIRKQLDPDKEKDLHFIHNPTGPHADYIPLWDLKAIAKKPQLSVLKAISVSPGKKFEVMKPSMAGTTDYFNTDELWDDWAQDKLEEHPLIGQPKIDGFRCILSKGEKVSAWFEDTKQDRTDDIKPIIEGLDKHPNFVLDCEIIAEKDDKPIPRTQLMSLFAGKLEAKPIAMIFDCLYWDDKDISQQPYSERYKKAQYAVNDIDNPLVRLVPQKKIKDKASLQIVGKWATLQDFSEGLMVKQADSPYEFGSTDSMAKWKTIFEIKVEVIEAIKRENGYTYHCGLKKDDSEFTNITEDLVDLGNTFITKDKIADKGDTLNVRIEELIILKDEDKQRLVWGKPEVVGIDKSRGAYFANQAIDMAKRAHIFKEETEKALGEEETRAERAEGFWEDNWYKVFPLSGKGKFVYHHHWRGLDEEESKLSEEQLLQTEHSVHGDLRLEGRDTLWGFTVFTGTTKDLREAKGNRLANLPQDDKLQGVFKLEQPGEWLSVGVKKPYISEPGGAGATSQSYAKFFAADYGTYDLGVMREHFMEIFVHGKVLKGRYLFQYAPVGQGGRKWLISKPVDQKPYAETHDLERIKDELKQKRQKYLVWAKPGEKPRLFKTMEKAKNIERIKITKTYNAEIVKTDNEKCLIYGVVLEPDTIDSQGDKVSAEEIERAAHKFLKESRVIYSEHERKQPNVYVVESYITPSLIKFDGHEAKAGSWILVTYCGDDNIWQQVKKGEFTGYSIRGYAYRE